MQNTQFKMAELRAELDIAQCFVDQAALAFNAGTLSAEDAAAAKLKTSELQQRVAEQVLVREEDVQRLDVPVQDPVGVQPLEPQP